jgi:iron complex outermembrane recepter protein
MKMSHFVSRGVAKALAVGRPAMWSVSCALVVMAPDVRAQQSDDVALDEIVVTAQKRQESLQDVPLSVLAVSGEKLADSGIVRLDDLKAYVPNLQMTETGVSNNIYIRGIGSGLNQGFEQSVSSYMDGIYRGRGHQSRMPFLDLARVEVLRGPQPILFGKNAVAGAVNMVSARPGDRLEGAVRVSRDFENNDTVGTAMLSGPVTDTFGARAALHYRQADGYVRNLTLNRDEPQRDELAGRLTLTWEPSDALDFALRVEGGNYDTKGRQIEIFGETPTTNPAFSGLSYSQIVAGGSLPLIGRPNGLPQGTNATAANRTIDFQRSSSGDSSDLSNFETSLTINYELSNSITLTSVTGYSKYSLDELCDCDFVGATVFNAGVTEDYKQLSEEIRFASATDQTVSWIAGVFYQDYTLDETDYLYVPPTSLAIPVLALNPLIGANSAVFANAANPRVFTQDSELWSVFAQATWNVSDALRLTAGGRFSDETKTGSRTTLLTNGLGGPLINAAFYPLFSAALGIVPHSLSGERSESNFSPLVNVQYDLTDSTMTYLSWSRGFKSGGFDARSNKPPVAGGTPITSGTFEFEDEQATTYELGIKSGIGSRAEINANVFYTDYKDLQTSAFDGAIGFNVGNGSAKLKGAEVEARWQATSDLRLTGSIAYLDFEWTKYFGQCYFGRTAIASGPNAGNCDYKGFTNQLAPELTAVIGAQYGMAVGSNLRLTFGADVVYSSEFLTSLTLDPATQQDAFTKINARIALGGESQQWEVALIGRNLTDETVVGYSGDTPLSNRLFGARSYYGFVDPPLGVAFEASYRF